MEKIKYAVLFLVFYCFSLHAQNTFIRPGLLRTQLTFSSSYLFADKQGYHHLHGNFEGYVKENISIAGEGYYFLQNRTQTASNLVYNHGVFFGTSYHFTKNNNDLYIGLQPGISCTKYSVISIGFTEAKLGINPLFSALIGYNLYVYKFFHFFIQGRFILGEHNYYPARNLNEFRLSAGLGFNLNTLKAK